MSRFRLRLPSPALVVGTVAALLALAGTGYAASTIGTSNIKNGAVTTKKIKNGAVTTKKIKNGAVTSSKIKNGAVTSSKINTTGLTAPNALHANSATTANSAGNANTVGGQTVTKLFQTLSPGATTTTFFSGDGLTLTQSCDGSGHNNIHFSATSDQTEMNTAGNNNNSFFGDLEDGVTTGTLFATSTFNEGNVVINYSTLSGQVVTIELGFDYPDSFSNQNLCGVWGHATVS